MPKVRGSKELTEHDVWSVLKNIRSDFGVEDISIKVEPGGYYPFKVTAECWVPDEVDRRWFWSHEFYTTERYPSLVLPMWKALNSLYTKIQRARDGLPPEY